MILLNADTRFGRNALTRLFVRMGRTVFEGKINYGVDAKCIKKYRRLR